MNDLSSSGQTWDPDRTVHARRASGEPALCGHVGNGGTQKRKWVTCEGCLREIERRLTARKKKGD